MAWRSFTLYKITIMLDIGKTVEVDHFYFIIGGSLSHYQVDQFYIDKRSRVGLLIPEIMQQKVQSSHLFEKEPDFTILRQES
ncbi:hypothetical protein [Desulfofundulus thermocisternus]|uniref:hypothetical protein n=1 Tax=Desulfofundulus thermocisternus TaxID=42471 RepID=UPI0019E2BC0F|nr:hypothetical protein [Desulfofundulus thermocisternus]MBE3584785.1 hypothetical protein [Thermoanaerobacter sp.]